MSTPLEPTRGTVEALLDAYRRGYFPMAEPAPAWRPWGGSHIFWPSPDPRGVLPLTPNDGLHVPRRLERRLRDGSFILRCDTAFDAVIEGCAAPRTPTDPHEEEGTWIDGTIRGWFNTLHEEGHAHSIEAWRRHPVTGEERLVGGVYGLAIGAAFFGESMFHTASPRLADGSRDPFDGTDASKVCLVTLVRHLDSLGFRLFDTQMVTEHVRGFGAREISRREYLHRLREAVDGPDLWRPLGAYRAPLR